MVLFLRVFVNNINLHVVYFCLYIACLLAETHLISLPQHTNTMSHHYFNAVVVILVSKYGVYSYTCGFIGFTCFCK